MRKYLLLFTIIIAFISCNQDKTEFKSVEKEEINIGIPKWMTQMDSLHPQAYIQYGHEDKGLYMIVLKQNKTEFLEIFATEDVTEYYEKDITGYYKMITELMQERSEVENISTPDTLKINDKRALITSFNKDFEGNKMYYKLAFIQSNNYFYQIMFWTLNDRKSAFEKDIEQSVKSFSSKE